MKNWDMSISYFRTNLFCFWTTSGRWWNSNNHSRQTYKTGKVRRMGAYFQNKLLVSGDWENLKDVSFRIKEWNKWIKIREETNLWLLISMDMLGIPSSCSGICWFPKFEFFRRKRKSRMSARVEKYTLKWE